MNFSKFHIALPILFSLYLFNTPFLMQGQNPNFNSENNSQQISLKNSLEKIEQKYDVYFIYEHNLLDGLEVPLSIPIEINAEESLINVLRYTSLDFKKISSTTYAIIKKEKETFIYGSVREKNGIPLVGANIFLAASTRGTISDIDGNFRLIVAPEKNNLVSSYVGYEMQQKPFEVKEGDSICLNFVLSDIYPLEQVIVVGSRLSKSSLLNNPSPADIVNTSKIEQSSQMETGQILAYSVPSFHSSHQTISDGTDHIDPATLRGLGSDQVLVLINGKRRHHSSLVNVNGTIGRGSVATDLNAIPLAAIERIEVLKDGAAAQYGSDAIAGVINIILKKKIGFIEFNSMMGLTQEGDGETFLLNGNYGMPIGKNGGFLNVTLDFKRRGEVNRSGAYTGKIYGDSRDENEELVESFFAQTGYNNRRVMSMGNSESNNSGLFFTGSFPLDSSFQVYTFGGFNYRLGKSGGFYRFPYEKTKQSGIYDQGFSPRIHTNIIDNAITLGTKGEIGNWNIDLSNTFGGNTFSYNIKNSNNASMGLTSPSSAFAGGFSYFQNVVNLDISKQTQFIFPINWGFGAESRLENYQQTQGDEVSWKSYGAETKGGEPKEAGFQVFSGFRPENETKQFRHNVGGYVNAEIEFMPPLLFGLAGRYEYYADFGSNFSWRVYMRYKLNKWISARATANTGFRAPSMPQIYFSSTTVQFISNGEELESAYVSHFNNESPTTRQFGIDPLDAETSFNFTGGLAFRLLKELAITIDAYQIYIKDRIVTTGRFSREDHKKFKNILDPIQVSKAQFFSNAIDTKTQGIDAAINYKLHLTKSELNFSLAGNFTRTRLKEDNNKNVIIKTSSFLEGFEDVLFNREEISRIEVAQPKSKLMLNLMYKYRKIEAAISTIRFGKVQYIHPEDGDPDHWVVNQTTGNVESRDQLFSPKWITDVNLNYLISNRVSCALGGSNIFNIYPDRHIHSANVSNGLFPYSRRVSQFGLKGAYWFLKLQLKM